MRHWLVEEWSLSKGQRLMIDCSVLYKYLKYKKYVPTLIDIDQISYKEIDYDSADVRRIEKANTKYPAIVVKGLANPNNKPYRMIDGRHRLLKNLSSGNKKISCYVVEVEVIKNFMSCGNSFDATHGISF